MEGTLKFGHLSWLKVLKALLIHSFVMYGAILRVSIRALEKRQRILSTRLKRTVTFSGMTMTNLLQSISLERIALDSSLTSPSLYMSNAGNG